MKSMKKAAQLCLAMLTVLAVVSLTKIDAKAAAVQITGMKQSTSSTTSLQVEYDTNNLSSNTYKKVFYRIAGSNAAWQETNSTYISGLNPGSTYEVWVKVYSDYHKKESDCIGISGTVEAVTKPGDYTSFEVKQGDAISTSSATVTWNACPGANVYLVEYKTATGESKTVEVTGTSVTLTNLKKNGTTYVYVTAGRKCPTYTAKSSNFKSLRLVVMPSKPGVKYTDITKKDLTVYALDNSGGYIGSYGGYEYDVYKVKGNKKIKTIKINKTYGECSNNIFAKKELFKVRIRGYVTDAAGRKYYTKWSAWNYFSNRDVIKSVTNKGANGIQVKWNKINGASGYKVYAATKNDPKSYKVVATIKKGSTTSATIKKFNKKAWKNGQRYYIYVEPFYKDGKKTYDSVNGYIHMISITYKK